MNFHQLSDDDFEFEIYNLNHKDIYGHYTILWNRKTDTFQTKKHGDFGSLTSFTPVKDEYHEPSPRELEVLGPIVEKEVLNACFYSPSDTNHRGEKLKGDKHQVCPNLIFDYRHVH